MIHPKFIVVNDPEDGKYLIIGKVQYHKNLAHDPKTILGGGGWSKDENTFLLFGASFDYGQAKLEDVIECVKNKKVFTNYTLSNNLTDDHTFKYQDVTGEITEI